METPSSSPVTRPGTPGLDIFKIAGKSISGYVSSMKTGDERQVRQPYMSTLEQRLLLYLEYHPHVCMFQRGDVSLAFAQARRLHTPLGTPYRINYTFDGKAHEYLPDFVGTLWTKGYSSPKLGARTKSVKNKHWPRLKRHCVWHNSKAECTG